MQAKRTSFFSERVKRHTRYEVFFIMLFTAFCVIAVLNINSGSIHIPVKDILKIIFLRTGEETQYNIIWKIRLPRIIMAAVLGGALALSGFLLQNYFRNPIASPFVLGISSGAKMMVAFTMILLLRWVNRVPSFVMVAAALVGSLMSMGFVLLFSRKIKRSSMLLVSGIMIGYFCSAATDFLITFAQDSDIVNLHNWSLGSFSGTSWDNVYVASIVVIAASVAVFLLSKPMGAFQLGESYAQSVGVNTKAFRIALIILSSILSACVTAFAGPISFVGIAAPYLVKKGLNTAKPLVIIPGTFLGGAVFCMLCDLIARVAFAPTELNISTVTAVFGVPVVIGMMLKREKGRGQI